MPNHELRAAGMANDEEIKIANNTTIRNITTMCSTQNVYITLKMFTIMVTRRIPRATTFITISLMVPKEGIGRAAELRQLILRPGHRCIQIDSKLGRHTYKSESGSIERKEFAREPELLVADAMEGISGHSYGTSCRCCDSVDTYPRHRLAES